MSGWLSLLHVLSCAPGGPAVASRYTILYSDHSVAKREPDKGRPVLRGPPYSGDPSLATLVFNFPTSRGEPVVDDNQSRTGSDKRKQSLYFPEIMLQEIKDEAARLDRSLSWVVQRAWKLARNEIRKIPSVNDVDEDDPGDAG